MAAKSDVFQRYKRGTHDEECWVWLGAWAGRERHRRPVFTCDGVRIAAYRAVYELVYGGVLSSEQMVLHSCDKGAWPTGCGNPKHLSIGDNRANVDDRLLRERHGLSHSVVRNIRKLLSLGRTQQSIADIYGVSRETVSAINAGRTYQHIKDEDNGNGQG